MIAPDLLWVICPQRKNVVFQANSLRQSVRQSWYKQIYFGHAPLLIDLLNYFWTKFPFWRVSTVLIANLPIHSMDFGGILKSLSSGASRNVSKFIWLISVTFCSPSSFPLISVRVSYSNAVILLFWKWNAFKNFWCFQWCRCSSCYHWPPTNCTNSLSGYICFYKFLTVRPNQIFYLSATVFTIWCLRSHVHTPAHAPLVWCV